MTIAIPKCRETVTAQRHGEICVARGGINKCCVNYLHIEAQKIQFGGWEQGLKFSTATKAICEWSAHVSQSGRVTPSMKISPT